MAAPASLNTVTWYWPAWSGRRLFRARLALVAWSMLTPLKRHWYRNGLLPLARTLNATEPETTPPWLSGCATMSGGDPTVPFPVGAPGVGVAAGQLMGSFP